MKFTGGNNRVGEMFYIEFHQNLSKAIENKPTCMLGT